MKKLILASACLCLAIPCQAKIITVDNLGSADFNTIQAAIDNSEYGDFLFVTFEDQDWIGLVNAKIMISEENFVTVSIERT